MHLGTEDFWDGGKSNFMHLDEFSDVHLGTEEKCNFITLETEKKLLHILE